MQLNIKETRAEFDKMRDILAKMPMPIIHDKHLAEMFHAFMSCLPEYSSRFRKPQYLDIITCHDYQNKSLLERSLDYLGIDGYVVLSKPFKGAWRNTLKLKWVLKYLESYQSTADYILFCDADDVIIKGDPSSIVSIFEKRKCEILFMSTSFMGGYACMPEVKRWTDRIHPGRYINSGVYIGKKDFLIELLREAEKYITDDDITANEYRLLGHGVKNKNLCERLPEFPKGCQDQDILRYIHPQFFPKMQIDFANELAFRNI